MTIVKQTLLYPHLVFKLFFVNSTILSISFSNFLFLFFCSILPNAGEISVKIEIILPDGSSCECFRSAGSHQRGLRKSLGKICLGELRQTSQKLRALALCFFWKIDLCVIWISSEVFLSCSPFT